MEGNNELTHGQKGGASRAVLKKRKKQEKLKQKAEDTSPTHSYSNADHNQSILKAKKAKKPADIFERKDLLAGHPILSTVEASFLSHLLCLKDPEQVDCYQKAALVINKFIYPLSYQDFYENNWEKTPILLEHSSLDYFGKAFFPCPKAVRSLIKTHVWNANTLEIINSEGVYVEIPDYLPGEEVFQRYCHPPSTSPQPFPQPSPQHTVIISQPQVYDDNLWHLLSVLEFEYSCRLYAPLYYTNLPGRVETEGRDIFLLILVEDFQFTLRRHNNDDDDKTPVSSIEYSVKPGDVIYIPGEYEVHYVPRTSNTNKNPAHRNNSAASNNKKDKKDFTTGLFMPIMITKAHARIADLLQVSLSQALYMPSLSSSSSSSPPSSLSSLLRAVPPFILSSLGLISEKEEGEEEEEGGEERRGGGGKGGRKGEKKKKGKERVQEEYWREIEKALQGVVVNALSILHPAADQLKKNFIAERLPLFLSPQEESFTSSTLSLTPLSYVRLLRPTLSILTIEGGKILLSHCLHNSREYGTRSLEDLEFELDDGPCLELLLGAYPTPVQVGELYHPSEEVEDKVGVAEALLKEGLLVVVDELTRGGRGEEEEEDGQGDEESVF